MIEKPSMLALAVTLAFSPFANAQAQSSDPAYDYRERTRSLAFDPERFFPETHRLWMSIVYTGDDYGYPVYAIAIRRGCTGDDTGEARRTCGYRHIARMVRAPSDFPDERPRVRGQMLFHSLAQGDIADDAALASALSDYGLEWLEADVRACDPAMAMLRNEAEVSFLTYPIMDDPGDPPSPIVIHADKVAFTFRPDHLTQTRYDGWLARGSAGEWANRFAQSLESCWQPAVAPVPWTVD